MIREHLKTYAVCPACGEDAGCINHLLGQTLETQWYCDACGQCYRLKFTNENGVAVDISVVEGKRKITTVDMLVLKPQDKPVYFIVKGMRFEGEDDDRDEHEHKQFFYEEHSCPTNWFKPSVVAFDGDYDPHGLIEFVATRDDAAFPPDETYGPNNHDFALQKFIEESMVTR